MSIDGHFSDYLLISLYEGGVVEGLVDCVTVPLMISYEKDMNKP